MDTILVRYEADLSKIKAQYDELEKEMRSVDATAQKSSKDLEQGFNKASKNVDNTEKSVSRLSTTLKAAGGIIASAFAFDQVIQFGKAIFNATAEFQKFRASVITLVGDKAKADKLIAELAEFAATTPFELTEIQRASQKLLAFGVRAEDVSKTLRALGDVSAGVGAPIEEIAELYGKAKVQGRLFAEDINQLTGRGIPIIQELAKQFGVTDDQVKGLVESGKIGFPNLEKAFISLTSEGGKFFNLMDAQSKTLGGQLSNLQDTFNQLLLDIGRSFEGEMSQGIQAASGALSELRENVNGTNKETTLLSIAFDAVKTGLGILLAPIKEVFSTLGTLFNDILKPIGNFLSAIFVPLFDSVSKALGGTGVSAADLAGKLNPLTITLKVLLFPLQLIGKALSAITPIITEHIVPAFQDFTIFLAKARNEVADFVNAIIDTGFAKRIQSTFGFEIAKIGKTNIDELRKSFEKKTVEEQKATEQTEKTTEAVKKQVVSIESLTEKVKQLKDERDKTSIQDIKKINSLNLEIARTEELIKRLQGQDEASKKLRKEREAYEKMIASTIDTSGLSNPELKEIDLTKTTKKQAEERHKARVDEMKKFQKEVLDPTLDASVATEEAITKKAQEEAEKRKHIQKLLVDFIGDALGQITNEAFDRSEQRLEDERNRLNEETEIELQNLEKKKEDGLITEAKYEAQRQALLAKQAQKEKELKTKQAQQDKQQALFQIAITTASNIVKALGTPPVPNFVLAGFAGAAGALQAGIVASRPIPKFAKGVVRLKGDGTHTSDSNLAFLSKDESVIPAKQSIKFEDELIAMKDGFYEKYIQQKYVLPALRGIERDRNKKEQSMARNMASMVQLMTKKDDTDILFGLERLRKKDSYRISNSKELAREINKGNKISGY